MHTAGFAYDFDSDRKKQIKAFYHYLADISNHVGIDEDGFFYPYKNVENQEFYMPIRPEGVMDSILMMWIWI